MKIIIGPYVNWYGPYQLADSIGKVFRLSEETCHTFGEWLSTTWIATVLDWAHKRKSRDVRVTVDKYDTWNVDSTLSIVIVPLLTEFLGKLNSYPMFDETEIPVDIKLQFPDSEDDQRLEAWKHFIREMIFAFESTLDADDDYLLSQDVLEAKYARALAGRQLFAKYFRHLWT